MSTPLVAFQAISAAVLVAGGSAAWAGQHMVLRNIADQSASTCAARKFPFSLHGAIKNGAQLLGTAHVDCINAGAALIGALQKE